MTYRIEGLDPAPFRPLFGMSQAELMARRARRVTASGSGYPCRISLEDAEDGEELLLVNFASHDVETPFRTTYAIYVRTAPPVPALFEDELPPMLDSRILGLRAFDEAGMLRAAALAQPGEGDRELRRLLERPEIMQVHAHNAAHGCFLAQIHRS